MSASTSTNVLVVGGGVAGFLAALAAKQAGKSVTLVARAGGATPAWSGAVDVACDLVGSTPGPLMPGLARGGSVLDNVTRLAGLRPRHPYARFSATGVSDIRASVTKTLAALTTAAAPLDLVGRDDGHNHVLATTLGSVKRCALVPRSQHLDLADVQATGKGVIGVVEWMDLAGFTARPVVELLTFAAGLGTQTPPFRVEAIVVPRVLSGDVFRDSRAMSRALDDVAVRMKFMAALKDAIGTHLATPTHVLVPAALSTRGLGAPALAAIDDVVGCPVRELLAMPPSSPGERLGHALREACEAAGVVVIDGAVGNATVSNGRVTHADVTRGAETQGFDVDAVILASGRFYGGGIVRDQSASERLFGLPVFSEGRLVDDQYIGNLTADHVDGDHMIFRAGVFVDEQLRPLTRDRVPLATNLRAAGSIIEGYDPARDGSGLGTAALTGWLSGTLTGRE